MQLVFIIIIIELDTGGFDQEISQTSKISASLDEYSSTQLVSNYNRRASVGLNR